MPLLLVRERPPLRLHATVATPAGNYYRWSDTELTRFRHGRSSSAITFATTMPGGFDQANLTLPRNPRYEYPDLEELSTVTIRGAGGRVAWQGRMETTPRTSGDQMSISPGLVGWQSHLNDDNEAKFIYLDQDMSQWQGASIQRKINILNAAIDETDASSGPDWSTGNPAVITAFAGPWSRPQYSEAWYDSNGIPLGFLQWTVWYATGANQVINPGPGNDTNWHWETYLSDNDTLSASYDTSAPLAVPGTGHGSLTATSSTRMFALLWMAYTLNGAAGGNGINYQLFWAPILQAQGAPAITTAGGSTGVLCSAVEAHAVQNWAPKLAFTTGANGTIQPSNFGIPQLVFKDPTTVAAIIKAANQYELRDWAVWEGNTPSPTPNPTYYSNPINGRGHTWQIRVRDAQLQETGPQAARLYNGVIVQYTDVVGTSRSAGPPNSTANQNGWSSSLLDPDPLNPANQAGIRKWAILQMQTSTPAAAIATGAQFLQWQKLLDRSGQASVIGHIQDTNGIWNPAWAIRAGDQIAFIDADDTSFRRIVSTSYDDTSKTNQLQLDAPPQGMQALLERLSVSLSPLGFS